MKKIFLIISFCFCLFLISSCKTGVDYSAYVSELRLAVYEGKSENFKAVLNAEKKEYPFIADGYVGEMKNTLILKVEFLNGSPDDASAIISYGEISNSANLSYNPVSGKSTASVTVNELPSSATVTVELTSGEISEKLTLSSVVFDKTINYSDAISSVASSDKETVDALFSNETAKAEIHVRIISGNGKNFYYVGFVENGGKTTAYLVDGETAEVLAKKTVN